jgi:hypothetical protein
MLRWNDIERGIWIFMQIQKQSSWFDFKSLLLYVWCIFIEFYHYAHILTQVANLNP